MNSSRIRYAGIALAVLLVLLYQPGLADFFIFDSKLNLLNNAALYVDFSQFNHWLVAAQSSDSGPLGRPLAMLSFALNAAWSGGLSASVIKFSNVAIHLLNGTVLYLLSVRLLPYLLGQQVGAQGIRAIAFTATALWLLHPLQVSTVLYSIQRMQQLSSLFVALGLMAYLHYRVPWLERSPEAGERSNCAVLVLLCLVAAVLSKENGVILLPLILLLEFALFDFRVGSVIVPQLRRAALLLAAGIVLAACWVVLLPPEWLLKSYVERDFSLHQRLLTESRVLWQYLSWFVFPDVRAMALQHDDVVSSAGLLQPLSTLFAVGAWILVAGLSVYALKRGKRLLFLVTFWFLICHSIESSILPLELVYEHRNYLALFGPCLLVSAGIWLPGQGLENKQRWALVGVLLLLVSGLLFSRTSLWASEEQMATYHLHRNPESIRNTYHFANTQLRLAEVSGDAEVVAQKLELSRHYYQRLLELSPGSFAALASLLYLDERYFSSHESQRWLEALEAELGSGHVLHRDDSRALGLLLRCQLQEWCGVSEPRLRDIFSTMAALAPHEPVYTDLYAIYLGQGLGELDQAQQIHRQLIERFPDYQPARVALATWYQAQGQTGAALEVVREMLGAKPSAGQVQYVASSFQESTP